MAASKGLGKGFDSLIPTDFDSSILLDESDRIQKLFISEVTPNREQPRKNFNDVELSELAASIKQFGILQPLIVAPDAAGYQIIAGERRWRAAQLAGLKQVPAIVRQSKDHERLQIALIENVQRVDLSPLEQAVSIDQLHQQFNLSYQEIATKLSKAVSTVNNIVRLLQLPPEARQALESGAITEGHARTILSLKDSLEQQLTLLKNIIKLGWSVRQAEQFVLAHKSGEQKPSEVKARLSTETKETKHLSTMLKTPVSLKRTARGGRIEIHFKDDNELNNLLDRFSSLS